MDFDDLLLDDPAALAAADRGGLLRAIASAGAVLREAVRAAAEAELDRLAGEGRPRALVVVASGGGGAAAEILTAVAGAGMAAPIVTLSGPELPGWVGVPDVVVALTASGRSADVLTATEEAARRGCRLITVGARESPLAERSAWGRGIHVPVSGDRPSRADLWALAGPLLVLADRLRLTAVSPAALEAAADMLTGCAERYRPSSETFVNPAKTLASDVAGAVPLIVGSPPVGAVGADRMVEQFARTAKYPAVSGSLSPAGYHLLAALDGPFGADGGSRGGGAAGDAGDFFRDRVDETAAPRLRLVLVRDPRESDRVAARATAVKELAGDRAVAVSEFSGEGDSVLERLASLVALADFAACYLALGLGQDPLAQAALADVRERLAE